MKNFMNKITIITAVLCGITIALFMFTGMRALMTAAITCATIFYHFVIRLAIGYYYNKKLNNCVNYEHKWFFVGAFEKKIYERLKVKRLKKILPTYDEESFDFKNNSYEKMLMVMCRAELVHETIVLFSFLPMVAIVWFGDFWVFFLTSLFSATVDMLFVVQQRYNRGRIVATMKKIRTKKALD